MKTEDWLFLLPILIHLGLAIAGPIMLIRGGFRIGPYKVGRLTASFAGLPLMIPLPLCSMVIAALTVYDRRMVDLRTPVFWTETAEQCSNLVVPTLSIALAALVLIVGMRSRAQESVATEGDVDPVEQLHPPGKLYSLFAYKPKPLLASVVLLGPAFIIGAIQLIIRVPIPVVIGLLVVGAALVIFPFHKPERVPTYAVCRNALVIISDDHSSVLPWSDITSVAADKGVVMTDGRQFELPRIKSVVNRERLIRTIEARTNRS